MILWLDLFKQVCFDMFKSIIRSIFCCHRCPLSRVGVCHLNDIDDKNLTDSDLLFNTFEFKYIVAVWFWGVKMWVHPKEMSLSGPSLWVTERANPQFILQVRAHHPICNVGCTGGIPKAAQELGAPHIWAMHWLLTSPFLLVLSMDATAVLRRPKS